MRPLIAITSSLVLRSGDEWTPAVHGQSHTYSDVVLRADGVPFLIPIFDDRTALRQLYEQCSGLLLSGGADIGPKLYGAKPSEHTRDTSPDRDKQEVQLVRWALEDNKPVLGICRGMQIINVVLGGSLHQDISVALPATQDHEMSANRKDFHHLGHDLKLEPSSRLAAVLGVTRIRTNALHHQAINRLGKGLKAVASTKDGIVEAIEMPDQRFVIGVQSHPESLDRQVDLWFRLFEAFVSESLRPRRSTGPVRFSSVR